MSRFFLSCRIGDCDFQILDSINATNFFTKHLVNKIQPSEILTVAGRLVPWIKAMFDGCINLSYTVKMN